MHVSSRSRLRLSIVSVSALVLMLAAMASPAGPVAEAAPGVASAAYTGRAGTVTRLATTKSPFTAHVATAKAQQPDRSIRHRTPADYNTAHRAAPALVRAPLVNGSALTGKTAEGHVQHNFNGVSSADSFAVNGFQDTPPDQGLCVGMLNNAKVVLEIVNSAATLYSTSGTVLAGPVNLGSLFADPNAFSDPRCFFDTATHTFFLTVISFDNTGNTVTDVEVVNESGAATTYQFSSSEGGTCFGDQPHVGYDAHALYIATDQFCATYEGALVIGVSKSQLVAQAKTVNFVTFGPVSLGGIPILTLEPAFGDASGTEYMLNSFPFDQFGNSNSIANTLGFWTVTGDSAITTGKGKVDLDGQIITSETYAFPMPAASTGTGAITCVPGNHEGIPPCTNPPLEPIQSERFLNPDDDRMLQVQLVNDEAHGLQLYAALDSAVTISGDPSARDGAAWFVLNPKNHKITDQGYVAVKGAYLLYPAILHTEEGTTALAFTATSTTLNPSTAFVVRKSNSHSFGSVQLTALGTGPHVSFAGPVFNQPRWGDYSAEELDPNGLDIWSASEYIPPAPDQASRDNWGTEVWDVTGDH